MKVKDVALEDDGQRQEAVLTIVASAEEVAEASARFFKDIAQRDIPGFRKGKAPRDVLEQSVGGHANAMGGVAEVLINEGAFGAIDDADVIFIDEPQFNVAEAPEEGRPFTFTVSGAVAPQMSLAGIDPVAIDMPPERATDAEVEAQLAELQDYYHSFEEIGDPSHAAEMGDYVMADITVSNHGKLVSGLNNTGRLIGLGTGTMPESFDEHLIGAKVGDELEFDFEAKGDDAAPELGDGQLHAQVKVKGFRRRVVPEIGDELAVKVGCTDGEDLQRQMRRSIDMQKAQELPKLLVERAIDALVSRLEGDVPTYFVDFMRQDVGRELMQSLDAQGTNLQQWMIENTVNGDDMKADVAREAARRAAIDCALEALFRAKGWEVTDEDIEAMFAEEEDPAAELARWQDAHRMADVRKMCRREKASRWLAETAEVTEVEEPLAKAAS